MCLNSKRFLADRTAPLCSMDIAKTFAQLRRRNTHAMSLKPRGLARIIQAQWTPFAELLYDLLILTFSDSGKLANLARLQSLSGLSPEEWEDLMQYTVQVSSNLVNYRSFDFTKIILGFQKAGLKLLCRGLPTRTKLQHCGPSLIFLV
ncbi:hypothetical protein D9757_003291 [Collybiopsis confluens]|uniref:Uncharacterized protein n=1 Tax=Collybiopsis confluens TaxID=2823264 RepID=A0A8H5MFG0_9AGAR|nr:hypothetical protein D9757_003291 [Collybiopsis confluens]